LGVLSTRGPPNAGWRASGTGHLGLLGDYAVSRGAVAPCPGDGGQHAAVTGTEWFEVSSSSSSSLPGFHHRVCAACYEDYLLAAPFAGHPTTRAAAAGPGPGPNGAAACATRLAYLVRAVAECGTWAELCGGGLGAAGAADLRRRDGDGDDAQAVAARQGPTGGGALRGVLPGLGGSDTVRGRVLTVVPGRSGVVAPGAASGRVGAAWGRAAAPGLWRLRARRRGHCSFFCLLHRERDPGRDVVHAGVFDGRGPASFPRLFPIVPGVLRGHDRAVRPGALLSGGQGGGRIRNPSLFVPPQHAQLWALPPLAAGGHRRGPMVVVRAACRACRAAGADRAAVPASPRPRQHAAARRGHAPDACPADGAGGSPRIARRHVHGRPELLARRRHHQRLRVRQLVPRLASYRIGRHGRPGPAKHAVRLCPSEQPGNDHEDCQPGGAVARVRVAGDGKS